MWLARREPGPQRSPKRQILDAAGYEYEIDCAVFLNWQARKIFSYQFVEEHSVQELHACVNTDPSGVEWRFYFNQPPGPSVRQQLKEALDLK